MSDDNKDTSHTLEKAGGWIRHTSEEVYDNPWIKVTHETVTTPKGTDGIYGLVHFKGRAVGVIPIDGEGNTWLVRQSRYTLNCHTWEIPEGGVPEGEDMLEGAQRELEEEVGLIASDWQELLTIHQSNSVTDEVGKVYIARDLSPGTQALEDTEDIEVKKLPLKEAIKMAVNGEITDSMSLAGLLKLAVITMMS